MIKHIKIKMAAGPLENGLNTVSTLVEYPIIDNLWWPLVENFRQVTFDPIGKTAHTTLVSPNPTRKWLH